MNILKKMDELCRDCPNRPKEGEKDYRLMHEWKDINPDVIFVTSRPEADFEWDREYKGVAAIIREIAGCNESHRFNRGTPEKKCELSIYWTHLYKCKEDRGRKLGRCPHRILEKELCSLLKPKGLVVLFGSKVHDWFDRHCVTDPRMYMVGIPPHLLSLEEYLNESLIKARPKFECRDGAVEFNCILLPLFPKGGPHISQKIYDPESRHKAVTMIRTRLKELIQECNKR